MGSVEQRWTISESDSESLDSVHEGEEDGDDILSTTEWPGPETTVPASFDGSGVVAAAVSSAIPQ